MDLSHWVQNASLAESAADYIWGRVSTDMWKASGVRVAMNLTIDIGQIVQLQHPASQLDVRALITKVSLAGQAGEVQQTLDLVLLPPTWTDFDASWAGKSWAGFDAAWAGKTWTDFDQDPTKNV